MSWSCKGDVTILLALCNLYKRKGDKQRFDAILDHAIEIDHRFQQGGASLVHLHNVLVQVIRQIQFQSFSKLGCKFMIHRTNILCALKWIYGQLGKEMRLNAGLGGLLL